MMQEEQKPNVTYSDVGGCQEPTEKLREALETPLLDVIQPLSYISIKEIPMLLYCVSSRRDSWILALSHLREFFFFGPLGTGKTLNVQALANQTETCFIRVNGTWSEIWRRGNWSQILFWKRLISRYHSYFVVGKSNGEGERTVRNGQNEESLSHILWQNGWNWRSPFRRWCWWGQRSLEDYARLDKSTWLFWPSWKYQGGNEFTTLFLFRCFDIKFFFAFRSWYLPIDPTLLIFLWCVLFG